MRNYEYLNYFKRHSTVAPEIQSYVYRKVLTYCLLRLRIDPSMTIETLIKESIRQSDIEPQFRMCKMLGTVNPSAAFACELTLELSVRNAVQRANSYLKAGQIDEAIKVHGKEKFERWEFGYEGACK